MQGRLPRNTHWLQSIYINSLHQIRIRQSRHCPRRHPRHIGPHCNPHICHSWVVTTGNRWVETSLDLLEIRHTRISLLPEGDVFVDIPALPGLLKQLVDLASRVVEYTTAVWVFCVRDNMEPVDLAESIEPVAARVLSFRCVDFVLPRSGSVESPCYLFRESSDDFELGWLRRGSCLKLGELVYIQLRPLDGRTAASFGQFLYGALVGFCSKSMFSLLILNGVILAVNMFCRNMTQKRTQQGLI